MAVWRFLFDSVWWITCRLFTTLHPSCQSSYSRWLVAQRFSFKFWHFSDSTTSRTGIFLVSQTHRIDRPTTCMCYYRYVFFLFVCLLVFFLFSRLPERHKLVRRLSKDIVFWRTLSSHPIHFFLCVRGRCFGLGPFRSLRKVNYWQAQAKLPAWKASDFLLSISLIHFSFCFCFVLFCLFLFCFFKIRKLKAMVSSRPRLPHCLNHCLTAIHAKRICYPKIYFFSQ